jgi:hypothetical protein
MHISRKLQVATGVALLSATGLVGATGQVAANAAANDALLGGAQTEGHLRPLNNSGANGVATVTVDGRKIDVSVDAKRLLKGMPHAMHVHFGKQARHECPTVRDDDNADHRINTVEGIPAYGPVRVSLTKRGDTSPKSTLAVKRFPTAPHHQIHYDRTIGIGKKLARAIANGKGVVVIHGIDYNHNGKYDFGAGKSDLDPSLPAEATDPAACGVLHESKGPLALQ